MKIKFIAFSISALILLFAFTSCNIAPGDNGYSTSNVTSENSEFEQSSEAYTDETELRTDVNESDTDTEKIFETEESESNKEQLVLGEVDFSKIVFITYDERFVEKYGSAQITVNTDEEFEEVIEFTMNLLMFLDCDIITNSGNASEKVIGLGDISNLHQSNEDRVLFTISYLYNDTSVIKELTRDPEIVQIIISVPVVEDE